MKPSFFHQRVGKWANGPFSEQGKEITVFRVILGYKNTIMRQFGTLSLQYPWRAALFRPSLEVIRFIAPGTRITVFPILQIIQKLVLPVLQGFLSDNRGVKGL